MPLAQPAPPKSAELASALAALLGVPLKQVSVRKEDAGWVASALRQTFALMWSASSTPGPTAACAVLAVEHARKVSRRAVPVVVAPFLSDASRGACEAAGASFFDLSGNAKLVAPGLRILVQGNPNRFTRPGRPASLFAPKSARVVRWLLMHPGEAFTQREIARSTGMTEGFVSRIAAGLERDSYVTREKVGTGAGPLRVKDPALLLDAWRDEYDFEKHTLIAGHVAARSGDALTRFVSDRLSASKVEHAATGLAAAWQMTHFAAFRVATFFVTKPPSSSLIEKLGFRQDPRGANLWLVVPNDEGVLQGASSRDGVQCVHPVQAYMDLKGHPERAAEAATRLRSEWISP